MTQLKHMNGFQNKHHVLSFSSRTKIFPSIPEWWRCPHLVHQTNLISVVDEGCSGQREQHQLVQLDQGWTHHRGQVTLSWSPQTPGQIHLAVGHVQGLNRLSIFYAIAICRTKDPGDEQVHSGGGQKWGDAFRRGGLSDTNKNSKKHMNEGSWSKR